MSAAAEDLRRTVGAVEAIEAAFLQVERFLAHWEAASDALEHAANCAGEDIAIPRPIARELGHLWDHLNGVTGTVLEPKDLTERLDEAKKVVAALMA